MVGFLNRDRLYGADALALEAETTPVLLDMEDRRAAALSNRQMRTTLPSLDQLAAPFMEGPDATGLRDGPQVPSDAGVAPPAPQPIALADTQPTPARRTTPARDDWKLPSLTDLAHPFREPGDELEPPDELLGVGGRTTYPDTVARPTPPVGTPPMSDGLTIDRSSLPAFMGSFLPAAQAALQAKGLPTSLASILAAIPVNEQGWQKEAPGNNYYGIKGSNPRTGANTGPVATWEDYGGGRTNIRDTFRAYDSPAESVQDFLQFLEDNPRYSNALKVARETGDPATFIREVHRAGYATDPAWSDKVLSIAARVPGNPPESQPRASGGIPRGSPAGDYDVDTVAQESLDDPDKWALCGPVAAVLAAQRYGKDWTVAQAKRIAQEQGLWDAGTGMYGLGAEVGLLSRMGLAATTGEADVERMAKDAATGNIVIVSTPRHYFAIQGFDPKTGRFQVGKTGTVFRGGSEWMTLDQIAALGGGIQGAAYIDNPGSPIPSSAAATGPVVPDRATVTGAPAEPADPTGLAGFASGLTQRWEPAARDDYRTRPGGATEAGIVDPTLEAEAMGRAPSMLPPPVPESLTPQPRAIDAPAPPSNPLEQLGKTIGDAISGALRPLLGNAAQAAGLREPAQLPPAGDFDMPPPVSPPPVPESLTPQERAIDRPGYEPLMPTLGEIPGMVGGLLNGPLAGPVVGGARYQMGLEVALNEMFGQEYRALSVEWQSAPVQADPNGPRGRAIAQRLAQMRQAVQQRYGPGELQALADRHPEQADRELAAGLAQSVVSAGIAPQITGAGRASLARQATASTIDPSNTPVGAAFEVGLGAFGQAARRAPGAIRGAMDALGRALGPADEAAPAVGLEARTIRDVADEGGRGIENLSRVERGEMDDYAAAYLGQYRRGRPGISEGLTRPDGSGELVYRGEDGRPVGVIAFGPDAITDVVVAPEARRQGVASALLDAAQRRGITRVRGPFTEEGAGLFAARGEPFATPEEAQQLRALYERPDVPGGATAPAIGLEARPVASSVPAPTFYSALRRTVEQKMPNRASADQVAGILRGSAVKPDELKWTGFDDFLAEARAQGRPVTKQEALDFLTQNEVRVEEVMRGGPPPDAARMTAQEAQQARFRAEGPIIRALEDAGMDGGRVDSLMGIGLDHPTARAALEQAVGPEQAQALMEPYTAAVQVQRNASQGYAQAEQSARTRYEMYQLPGGENYRELLLTLPPKVVNPNNLPEMQALRRRHEDISRRVQEARAGPRDAGFEERYQRLIDERDEIENAIGDISRGDVADQFRSETYRSSHWDEPNVLAHVRFNERADAEGRRVLFVEEIQSDWHQAGRKYGYRGDPNAARTWRILDSQGNGVGSGVGRTAEEAMADLRRIAPNRDIARAEPADYEITGAQAVPAAPFSKTWPELAFKRVLRWASENGFDRVAWTTGAQQAERYDLSRRVGRVLHSANPDGTYNLIVQAPTANQFGRADEILHRYSIPAKELDEIVGGEVAQRIRNGVGEPSDLTNAGVPWQSLSGEGLRVGGEGMKGFYDRILPEVANKLGKKFGARVRETAIPAKPSAGQELAIVEEGGVYQVLDRAEYDAPPIGEFGTRREAEQFIRGLGDTERVHAIDITPEMRRSVVEEGQPLFQGIRPPNLVTSTAGRMALGAGAGGAGEVINAEAEGREVDPTRFWANAALGAAAGATIRGRAARAAGQIVTPEFARQIPMEVRLPSDETFRAAVQNTPGAEITSDGLLVQAVRWQPESMSGDTSIRTGVFYLTDPKNPNARYYKKGTVGYGGGEQVGPAETLLKAPLFVKGQTGGKAPQMAYDAIAGKGAYERMRGDVIEAALSPFGWRPDRQAQVEAVARLLEKYGGDPDLAGNIVHYSQKGNTLAYAIQEHIVAARVREAGYDSVLGYTVGRDKQPVLSELFDVREMANPTAEGYFRVHPQYEPRGIGLEARATQSPFGEPERMPATRNARTWAASVDDPRKQYTFTYEVQPLDQLVTSHTDALAPNPRFPQDLQPRLRDRAGSQDQINRIAAQLSPDALIAETHRLDSGAPIIGEDFAVESGNGRTIALRLARQQHPERWAAYQEALRAHAHEFGIDPRDLEGVRDPVLVRVRESKVDRPAFAAEANQAAVLEMSPFERAAQDARRVTPDLLASLDVPEGQSIDRALTMAGNRPVVRRFMEALPANERAALMTDKGELNAAGLERVKNALFAATYQGEAGGRLANTFIESLDPGVKNVENGMFASLPAMARAEGMIRAGERAGDLSLSDDLARATDVLARLRQEGMSVPDYLAQASMFERELNPLQEQLLSHLDSLSRSPKRIREFISRYAEGVEAQPHPDQASMFGDAPGITKGELVDRASAGATSAADAEGQGAARGLFDEPAGGAAPEAAAAPEAGARLEEPGPRAVPPEASGPGIAPSPPAQVVSPPPPVATTPPPAQPPAPPTIRTRAAASVQPASAPVPPSPPSSRGVAQPQPITGGTQAPLPAGMTPQGPPRPPYRPIAAGAVPSAQPPAVPASNPHNARLAQMFGQTPKAPDTTIPLARRIVAKLTDDRAPLAQWQKDLVKVLPPGTAPDDLIAHLTRVNPDSTALQRLNTTLPEVRQILGTQHIDPSTLSVYLAHVHNIDIANEFGRRAYEAAIAKGANPSLAQRAGARAAQARNFSGGMKLPDIVKALQDLEADLGPDGAKAVRDAADRVWTLNRESLERKYLAGGLDAQQFADLSQRYPHYVTTDITDHLDPETTMAGTGRSISQRQRPFGELSEAGTTKDRLDPLTSVVMHTIGAERWAAKNDRFRTFFELVNADPNQAAALGLGGPKSKLGGTREVAGFVNGRRETMILPHAIAELIESGPAGGLGALGEILAKVTGPFKAGLTTYNPGFQYAVNPLRDLTDFMVRQSAQEGGPQHLPRVLKAWGEAIPDVLSGVTEGRFTGKDTARYAMRGGLYDRAGSGVQDMERIRDGLLQSRGARLKSPGELARFFADVVTLGARPVGGRLELIPRVAGMKLAERRGATPLEAMIAGREASVPFEVAGEWGRALNTAVPFLNATVQAGAQFGRSLRDHPVGTVAGMFAITGNMALAAQAWNRRDEERKRAYDDVPQYLKDSGVVFMTPWSGSDRRGPLPNYVWIPLGSFAPAAMAMNTAVERVMGDANPRDFGQMLTAAATTFSPIKGESVGAALSSAVPPGISTAIELAQNKDFYRGATIATDERDRRASSLSQGITQGLRQAGKSGLPLTEGLQDVRPSQVEYLLQDVGGVWTQIARGASDLATGREDDRDRPIQDTPVVGGLAGRLVRDQPGQLLENARARRIPDSVREIIRSADLNPDEIVTPVAMTVRGIPLTRVQQEQAQGWTNGFIAREIEATVRSPEYRQPRADREKLLREAVNRAKEQAVDRVLSRVPGPEQQRLKREEAARKAG